MSDEHVEQQRAFYDERAHDHLQVQHGDLYAEKLAAELARRSKYKNIFDSFFPYCLNYSWKQSIMCTI